MLNQILNSMFHLNIQLKEVNNKTKLIYEPGLLDQQLKEQIKEYKTQLIKRIEENEAAMKLGFLVFNHGQVYEYRFGLGSYIYIERLPNGLASAWRENFMPKQQQAYKTKTIIQNAPFNKAYQEAEKFICWLNKQQRKKVG